MTQIIKGVNDLATLNPELAKQWHPTKNGELKPTDVTTGSNRKVWWLYSYDDPKTNNHFDFEWTDSVDKRNRGANCPFLTGHGIWQGFNDLATINPELAKQWHPTKNGNLKPTDVTANSNKKVWWLYPYDDENTDKHFDFEWQATVASRNNGIGCPYLSGKIVEKGFNDLATVNPELAKQWHPTKNGNLKPTDVMASSNQKVWWLYPYDNPKTGKHFDFEWMATIANRNRGIGCPYLSGNPQVWVGFNDLATVNPELAKEWHPTKNGDLKPTEVTGGSSKKVWWFFPTETEDGEIIMNEWTSSVIIRNKETVHPFSTLANVEKSICEFLQKENIKFEVEKTFKDCKDKKELPFDMYLSDANVVIEYDGMQSFRSIDFFGGEESFKKTNFHNNIKNTFCKENNISILRIPYIYNFIMDKEGIESLVLDFIKTKTVPQEILDIYSKCELSNYVECAKELNEKALKN